MAGLNDDRCTFHEIQHMELVMGKHIDGGLQVDTVDII